MNIIERKPITIDLSYYCMFPAKLHPFRKKKVFILKFGGYYYRIQKKYLRSFRGDCACSSSRFNIFSYAMLFQHEVVMYN